MRGQNTAHILQPAGETFYAMEEELRLQNERKASGWKDCLIRLGKFFASSMRTPSRRVGAASRRCCSVPASEGPGSSLDD